MGYVSKKKEALLAYSLKVLTLFVGRKCTIAAPSHLQVEIMKFYLLFPTFRICIFIIYICNSMKGVSETRDTFHEL